MGERVWREAVVAGGRAGSEAVKDGRACERRAEYEKGDCKPRPRNGAEVRHVVNVRAWLAPGFLTPRTSALTWASVSE